MCASSHLTKCHSYWSDDRWSKKTKRDDDNSVGGGLLSFPTRLGRRCRRRRRHFLLFHRSSFYSFLDSLPAARIVPHFFPHDRRCIPDLSLTLCQHHQSQHTTTIYVDSYRLYTLSVESNLIAFNCIIGHERLATLWILQSPCARPSSFFVTQRVLSFHFFSSRAARALVGLPLAR